MIRKTLRCESLETPQGTVNRLKTPRVVIVGGDELAKGVVKLRDMGKNEEAEIKTPDLAARVCN